VINHLEACRAAGVGFRLDDLGGTAGGVGDVGLHRVDDFLLGPVDAGDVEHIVELLPDRRGETSRCRAHSAAPAGSECGRRRRDSGRGHLGAGETRVQRSRSCSRVSMAMTAGAIPSARCRRLPDGGVLRRDEVASPNSGRDIRSGRRLKVAGASGPEIFLAANLLLQRDQPR